MLWIGSLGFVAFSRTPKGASVRTFLFVSLTLAAFAGHAVAHHGIGAEYDMKQSVTVTGTVKEVQWVNPHVHIFLDSKAEDGTVTTWGFQLGTPNNLMHDGWTRNSLKPGDVVTIEGGPAKDGSHIGVARTILFNGKKMFGALEQDLKASEK